MCEVCSAEERMSQALRASGERLSGLRANHHLAWPFHPGLELLWLQQTPGTHRACTSTRRLITRAMEKKMPRKKRSMTWARRFHSSWQRWAALCL